jgi:mannose/cellobiose epimerase-like protein (N-acyl-D-glucosamine 2-epimerase family)
MRPLLLSLATLTLMGTLLHPNGAATASPAPAGTSVPDIVLSPAGDADWVEVPEVLKGDTWLRHHAEDLMPYWDMPEALGHPVGNFPSFRGRAGELLPGFTNRGLSTLSRGVYGYSLAYMLTGRERYLGYAKAGLDWINAHAKDPVHGGYYGELDASGQPVAPLADKDLFDLASVALAYGMYFNVTRDASAEADLLAVRDLIFDKYYDAATKRFRDSLSYDLSTEVDTGGNGGDITNLLVPGTALLLPNAALLTEAARREQFREDLRLVTQNLIDRHKNTAAATNRWWFWGRTARFGNFNAAQTDFGHTIKSYEMIHNANRVFPDRPWEGMAADRSTMMGRAWDAPAARWNQRLRNFTRGNVEPDSAWWIHDEADQTLAALDLADDFAHADQLAISAQSWLDVFVDHDPAYPGETFARIERTGSFTDLRKSFFGKNMLHAHEHALIMYLHGRAMEGRPAKLHYAFPSGEALSAVARPYWFDSAGQSRTVGRDLSILPGHRAVDVWFTGLDSVLPEPYPAPSDTTAPTIVAAVSPPPNDAGWHRDGVAVSLSATDDGVGVKQIHASVEADDDLVADTAFIHAGDEFALPLLAVEGSYSLTFHAVDTLGNSGTPQTMRVRIDGTAPSVTGTSSSPDGNNGWHVTPVSLQYLCADALSGVAACPSPHLVGEGVAQHVVASGWDRAGNSTSFTGGPFNVDLTDPFLECRLGPTFLLHQPGEVTATVTDGVSGPVSPVVSAAADTSSVGAMHAGLTGSDVAGRVVQATCGYQVHYGFSGFLSPVDHDAVNVTHAGSVVPFKWRLADYEGNPITDLSAVTVRSLRHACGEDAAEDPLEEVAAGASGLQNLGDGYYQLNWKSAKAYAGSCRTVELDLGEGAPRAAEFRFKR